MPARAPRCWRAASRLGRRRPAAGARRRASRRATPQGRTVWVTRARPKIDRIACPWLIRRFVDPGAVFLFVPPAEVAGVAERFGATPFDIEGDGCSGAIAASSAPSTSWSRSSASAAAAPLRISRASCAAPTPRGSTSRRRRRGCSPPRSGCRGCTATTSRSSTPAMLLYDAFYRWCRDATGRDPQLAGRPAGPGGRRERRLPRRRPHGIRFAEATAVWARVAALSFGGPAGQIAVMHRILVDEKRWVGERRFLHALNFCMLLPGPEAHQLAIYLGWLMHGARGGLVAGALFVLPGYVAMMALSAIYVACGPHVAGRRPVLRAEGGGAGHRPAGGGAHRPPRASAAAALGRSLPRPSSRSSPSACRSRRSSSPPG